MHWIDLHPVDGKLPDCNFSIRQRYACKSYIEDYIWGSGWIIWNIVSDVYILIKGKKSINAEENENVELTHARVFCGRLCVMRITVNKNKLYWSYGYLLVQNADYRPDTKCRLAIKCRRQTAEWVQNADSESEKCFRLVCDNMSSCNLRLILFCETKRNETKRNRFRWNKTKEIMQIYFLIR